MSDHLPDVSLFECYICFNEYDDKTRRPCIGTCGHSICENCRYLMISSRCPHCNREEAFVQTTINYQVLELLKHLRKKPGENQNNMDDKISEEGKCSECKCAAKKLRICVTCGMGNLLEKKNDGKLGLIIEKDDPKTAIENALKVAICSDCALDGEHTGHKTDALSNFKSGLEDKVIITKGYDKIAKSRERLILYKTDLDARVDELIKQLDDYAEAHISLTKGSRTEFLKQHFGNNLNVLSCIIEDTFKGMQGLKQPLDKITETLKVQTTYIKNNNKPYEKDPCDFHPVLIADRKQMAKDALLIGMFHPGEKTYMSIGRMPNPKSNYAVAALDKRVYIVGGMNSGSWLDTLEIYDRGKNIRKDGPKMKIGRTRTSAGFHKGKLYVCGGYSGSYMNSVEVYDPDTNTWSDGPSLQRVRADCAVVSCEGKLYVLGGYNGKEYEEKIEVLDDEQKKWVISGDMQGSRAGFGACSLDNKIYIAGGWSNSNNTLKTVRSYEPEYFKWREEPSMSKDRKYFTLHSTHEAVYAVRGCADSWNVINEIERLDIQKRKWEIMEISTSSERT